ncbi:MAG TPA: peptidoglycan DD-metalloendopeptidase family protein [Candidatus Limnocylindria bacterium]|nr:peptidoglycan DD-metalloendopeptidase family protein [Candidatus Limnocylindria bacterium]
MKRGAALALAAALGVATAALAQDSLETAKRRELQEIERQAAETKAAAGRLRKQEVKELGGLRRTERQMNLTNKRLRDLGRRRQSLDMQLEVTRVDLQRNVQSLAERRRQLRSRLRAIYKFGPARELEFLLSTESFAQLLARWDYLLMIAQQDRLLMDDVRDRKEHVEVLERRLEGHLTQVERTTRQTTSENQRLAKQRRERQTLVRGIQSQRATFEAAAAELEKTAQAVKRLIAQLEAKRREEAARARAGGREPQPYTGDFAKGQGALAWPARGELVGRFGPEIHPRFKTKIFNNGVDISVAIGTSVRSVAKGRVDYTSEDYGTYGQMIILNHGDGYYTLYGHLSAIQASVGQEVSAGQAIGRSGDSGSLKGAILHFEVRRGASALDPETWLQ